MTDGRRRPRRQLAAAARLLPALLLSLAAASAAAGSLRADSDIVGDVQSVHDRAIIVVDRRPILLWGVVAPRAGEPDSGATQLLLRKATLGRRAVCEPLGPIRASFDTWLAATRPGLPVPPRIVARCRVGLMDLSALLVSSGYGRPCAVGGQRPYARLVPRAELAASENLVCPGQ